MNGFTLVLVPSTDPDLSDCYEVRKSKVTIGYIWHNGCNMEAMHEGSKEQFILKLYEKNTHAARKAGMKWVLKEHKRWKLVASKTQKLLSV